MTSIVVVNYNTDDHLLGCLGSLAAHGEAATYEVVVVNNGEPVENDAFGHLGLDLRVVNNCHNVGYAAALNQGIFLTRSANVLCLNADTRLGDGSIEPLVAYLEGHPEAGLVAPRLSYPDGSLQYSCRRRYDTRSILGRRLPIGVLPMVEPALRHHLMLDENHDHVQKPDWVQGSCMLIPRSVIEAVGPFDERFFLYFEDYDYCARILSSGLEVVYQPESDITHYYARSSANLNLLRREVWHHATSALKYLRKVAQSPS